MASRVQNDVQFRNTFNLFDLSGCGKIDVHRVGECLRILGLNPSESEVQVCIQSLNPPKTRITFEDFLYIYEVAYQFHRTIIPSEFIETLRLLDSNKTGLISAIQLRHILTKFGEKLTSEEVDQLLVGNVNAVGMVNYTDFVYKIMGR